MLAARLDLVLEAVGARVIRYRVADSTATEELRAVIAGLAQGGPLDFHTAALRLVQAALSRR